MTIRVSWEDVRDLIEKHTGPIRSAEPVSDGRNSEIAVIIRTDAGTTFVKGLRLDHPRVWTQQREMHVNPYVRHLTAGLRWSAEVEEWHLLGFEHIPGRSADYSPGSPDLPLIVTAMQQLQDTPCPDIEMKQAEHRWASYTDTPELFTGDHLLHTEWTNSNVLITDRAYLIDWAWPTKGAPWIDPACWAVWLIAAGHTPHQAEGWAARMPSWGTAPAHAVDEFVWVQAAMWDGIAADNPAPWAVGLANASRDWVTHRSP